MKRKKIKYKKIFSQVSEVDYKRLEEIKRRFGFKSQYEILKYLIHCFLRVADPANDTHTEIVPDEIKDMFSELEKQDQASTYEQNKIKQRR